MYFSLDCYSASSLKLAMVEIRVGVALVLFEARCVYMSAALIGGYPDPA